MTEQTQATLMCQHINHVQQFCGVGGSGAVNLASFSFASLQELQQRN
jgi:hypothetical protein